MIRVVTRDKLQLELAPPMPATSNPPAVSVANAPYQLWCLVQDESTPFKIRVMSPTHIDVHDLKELILDRGKAGTLKDVDAKDLTLWKVSHFQRVTDSR